MQIYVVARPSYVSTHFRACPNVIETGRVCEKHVDEEGVGGKLVDEEGFCSSWDIVVHLLTKSVLRKARFSVVSSLEDKGELLRITLFGADAESIAHRYCSIYCSPILNIDKPRGTDLNPVGRARECSCWPQNAVAGHRECG